MTSFMNGPFHVSMYNKYQYMGDRYLWGGGYFFFTFVLPNNLQIKKIQAIYFQKYYKMFHLLWHYEVQGGLNALLIPPLL